MRLHIPVPPGELIDKITILKVKLLYIKEKKKAANIQKYLKELEGIRKSMLRRTAELARLERQLLALNKRQWQIEDAIRLHLKNTGPDQKFGALVSSMHESNNRRAAIKRKIDDHLGSDFLDEKSYAK